ncbi:hypothetical protein BAL199_22612 [alpha proteobacterium BAL199]|nr:hypothetical protein BAL199_22612 [alpha proteobacterium BAL199]
MNLPTTTLGGFDYADTAVMFRRLTDGSFELIVTPWDSDLARSWRQASAQRQTLFRLVVKIKRVSPSGSADFRHAFADARVSSV